MPTDPSATHHGREVSAALLAAAVCGAILPVQSRINGRLAELVDPAPAAIVSFGSGLLILTLILILVPATRLGLRKVPFTMRIGGLRWWEVIGGVGGGLLVAAQTYAVPLVGVTAFLIAVIGGQSVSALAVDRAGLAPGGVQPLSASRIAAASLAVVGVAVAATAPGRGEAGGVVGLALVLPLLLAFLAGAGQSVQQAYNGVVTTVSRDALATAWLNFFTGTSFLLVLGAVAWVVAGLPGPGPTVAALPWWAWVGGATGVVFIALAAWAMQHLPVLAFALVTVTTQLVVGVLLDLADPVARQALGPQVLAGVALALVASAWAAAARRRGAKAEAAQTEPSR